MHPAAQMDKAALLSALTLISPALGGANFVPILSHVCLDGDQALAYNDVIAMAVALESSVPRALPGELLLKLLGTIRADSVKIEENSDSDVVLVSKGSRVKVPSLPVSDFPFSFPSTSHALATFDLSSDDINGIEACLVGVGGDATHPIQMGVTLQAGGFYSTDNFTMTRYLPRHTELAVLRGASAPAIIIPTEFCRQLVRVARHFSGMPITIYEFEGAIMAWIAPTMTLFSKLVNTPTPPDFVSVFQRFVPQARKETAIPEEWEAVFSRAALVTQGQPDAFAHVRVSRDGVLEVEANGKFGQVYEELSWVSDSEHACALDPALVLRGSKLCTSVALCRDAMVLTSSGLDVTHLVSYCRS